MQWLTIVPVFSLLRKIYISTPDFFIHYQLNVLNSSNLHWVKDKSKPYLYKEAKLAFTWILDHYDVYNFYLDQKAKTCTEFKTNKCFNFTFPQENSLKNKDFIVFKFYEGKKSWNKASKICKGIGGFLPSFTSRSDLQKLLAFLKFKLVEIPKMFEIFIGLKYAQSEVGLHTF